MVWVVYVIRVVGIVGVVGVVGLVWGKKLGVSKNCQKYSKLVVRVVKSCKCHLEKEEDETK